MIGGGRIVSYRLSCIVSEIYPSIGPKSLYLATPSSCVYNAPDGRGSPGTISVEFYLEVMAIVPNVETLPKISVL